MTSAGLFLIILFVLLIAGILSGVPAFLAIAGVPLLVALIASLFGVFDLTFLLAYPPRAFGVMSNTLLMAVPLFILMGVLLERSHLAERMLDILSRMLGSSPRGLALSVLLVSTLIAASTGIIGATIVMLGLISLPAMLRNGLSPRLSSGLICACGTLGQIIPPSILLVLLGDQIANAYLEGQQNAGNFAPDTVSTGDLFAGALFPGLVLVGLYGLYILFAARGQARSAGVARDMQVRPGRMPSATELFGTFLPPLALIVSVLGSILAGIATITEAAGVGAAGTLFLAGYQATEPGSLARKLVAAGVIAALFIVGQRLFGLDRIDFSTGLVFFDWLTLLATGALSAGLLAAMIALARADILSDALLETIKVSAMVFAIILAASMLSLVFRGFGGDEMVEAFLTNMPGEKWGALAVVMISIFLLGFVLEVIEIIYIVIPLVGPVLLATDFDPIWFAILVAMNLQTSFLTPPFGFALFYFRSVAPASIPTGEIYRSVVPFVAIQILAMLILVLFPGLATWLPHQVFR